MVDDEKDITLVLQAGLQGHGFEVDSFNDPRKALSHFKTNYYNALVIDVRMPGMTGFDLAKQIWARDPSAKICFLSAFEIYSSEAQKVFTNFKSRCFIKKPILPSALAEHINSHLVSAS